MEFVFTGSTNPAALLRTALMSFRDLLLQWVHFRTCRFLTGKILVAEYWTGPVCFSFLSVLR